MTQAYAGIGSRSTPAPVQIQMRVLAQDLRREYWTLRSGGAKGADSAFASGTYSFGGIHLREIYLPRPGYNHYYDVRLERPMSAAFDIAAQYHPAWNRLPLYARELHARNSHIILGAYLNDPVEFVACWTEGGAMIGGTSQALRIAEAYDIPIFNFGLPGRLEELRAWLADRKASRKPSVAWTEVPR